MGLDEGSGRPLGGECPALVIVPGEAGGAPVGVVSTGERCSTVRPERLGEFLVLHRTARFVCHDAGAFFWTIHDLLRRPADTEVLDVLWDLARTGRLHDV